MTKNKTIWSYFSNHEDYPKQIAHEMLPYDTVYAYVSSTFLNGLINYVKPVKVFQIDRYTQDHEIIENVVYKERKIFTGPKAELRKLVLEEKVQFHHTNLGVFQDDIVILAEIETKLNDGLGRYMFFWFDYDVSDCCIGKFETEDSKEEVIESLINWLDKEEDFEGYTELPNSFVQGWVEF